MPTISARRWLILTLLSGAALIGLLPAQNDQESREHAVLQTIAKILPEGHLSRHALDDSISRLAMADFVKDLDPLKLYFLKSDMDSMLASRDQLDDMVRQGDDSMAKTLSALFLKRLEERVGWTHEILRSDLHFDREEYWPTDAKTLDHPSTEAEARDRWRKRLKYELLVMEGPDLPREQAIGKLIGRYDRYLSRMKGMDELEWLSIFVNAVTTAYDPHTTWLAPRALEEFEIAMRLNFQGIGAQLNDEDGIVTITGLIRGGAAIADGKLEAGDKIIAVAQGDDGPWVDVIVQPLSDVVDLIRGPKDTVVRLKIRPKNGGETRVHRLVRRELQLEDSAAHGEVFKVKDDAGKEISVGVIDLPEFYRDDQAASEGKKDFRSAARDVAKILAGFRSEKVDAVVLDLRFNGGGSLREAIDLTGLFIDQGPVVQVRNSRGRLRELADEDKGMAWTGPLVVLTSRFSASASEILAGAIQDYSRGLIVGDLKTHGKGTVQSVIPLDRYAKLEGLGALKLTIQQFYRPGGLSTQRRGVTPDVILPSVTSELKTGEDELAQALPFDEIKSADFVADDDLNPATIESIRDRSAKRREASKYFARIKAVQELSRKRKEMSRMPLEEKAFQALRAEEKSLDEESPEAARPKPGVINRDGYLDEALAITADLARAQHSRIAVNQIAEKVGGPALR